MDRLSDEALDRLFDEARHLVVAQRESLEMVDSRLSSLLRFDAILLGVMVTLGSLLWRAGVWTRMSLFARILGTSAILFLLGSILATVLAYRAGRLTIGLRAESVVTALDHRADERQLLKSMVRAYGRAITVNAAVLERTRDGLNVALWSLVLAMVSLSASSMVLWMGTPQ